MPYEDVVNVIFVADVKQGDVSGLTKVNEETKKTGDSAERTYRSLQQLGMTTWFLSIGVMQVTNTLKMMNKESEIGTARINLLQQTMSSMTFGFYAITNLTKMGLMNMSGGLTTLATTLGITAAAVPGVSLAVGALFAVVTGIIPVVSQWNAEMEKAYANVTKTGTQIEKLFQSYFDAKNVLETSNALAQINAVLGEDFVNAVKNASTAMEAFYYAQDLMIKKSVEAWKNTKEGKEALEKIKEEMRNTGEGITQVTQTIYIQGRAWIINKEPIYDNVILMQKLIEAWKEYNKVAVPPDISALIKRGEALTKLYGGAQEPTYYFGKEEKVVDTYSKYLQAYRDYQQQMAKLRDDEEAQFELQLQEQVDKYREAGLSKLQIDEYIKLSRQKHQEEMTQKEIEEVFKREQAEWDAIQKQKQQEQQLAQERENIRKSFESKYQSYMYSELEITERTLREEYNAYIEAGGNIQTGVQIVQSVITNLVMQETQKRIQEIEKERDAKLQALDKEKQGRETLYYRIVELGQNETQNELMELIKRKNEYESYINDKVLLETWFNKEAKSIWQNMWDDYNRQVEEAVEQAKQTRIQAEQNINDKIMQLSSSNLEYQIFNLQREVNEYAKAGVSIEQIQEYTSLRIKQIKEDETNRWIQEEERKLEMQQSAYNRYLQFIYTAQGKESEIRLLTIQQDVQNLISTIYTAYGEAGASMIENIFANLPDYIRQTYPNFEFTEDQINSLIETLKNYYNLLLNPPTPPPIGVDITIPEPTDVEKEAKEKIVQPPTWEEFQAMITEVEGKFNAINMIIGGWYSSAQTQLRLIYDALIVEEEKKAHTLIDNIVKDITHYDWASLGITSGSGFGEGFLAGFEKWIPAMAQEIARYFEFHSPPEKGALRDTENWGEGFILEFIKGMLSGKNYLDISLLALFQQLPFSAYASVVLRNLFAETYPQITKGSPYTAKQMAWYHPEMFFQNLFAGVEELFGGKEIYQETTHKFTYGTQEYVKRAWDLAMAKTNLQQYISGFSGMTPEREQALRAEIEKKYGITGGTLQDVLDQVNNLLDATMDYVIEHELPVEMQKRRYTTQKYGLLGMEFPEYGKLYEYWAQVRQEQGLDNIIKYLRPLVEKNFGFSPYQGAGVPGYNYGGQPWGVYNPSAVFGSVLMPSLQQIQNYLSVMFQEGLELVGGNPLDVLAQRARLEKILPILQQMGISTNYIPPVGGMWKLPEETLSYLERIVQTYQNLIRQMPELAELTYEQIREKMLIGIDYLMTPAMDLFSTYFEKGWQDWMKEYADIQTKIWRYSEFNAKIPGQVVSEYGLKQYELFDVYKTMYENLPKEQGIEFFQKIFEEGLKIRQQYIQSENEEMAKKQVDVLKYSAYFLMEKYGLAWEDVVKGIDENLLKDLFPDLGKIFLQPEYNMTGTPGVTSTGGIVINLNFNIENINDVNINDFISLVATELLKQLNAFIYV